MSIHAITHSRRRRKKEGKKNETRDTRNKIALEHVKKKVRELICNKIYR